MWKVKKHSFMLVKSNSRPIFALHLKGKVQLLLKAERCWAWWPPAARGLSSQGMDLHMWVIWLPLVGFTPGFLQQIRLMCLASLWDQGNSDIMGYYWLWVMRIHFGCWADIARRSCWLPTGWQSMYPCENKLLDTKDSKSLFIVSLRVIWPHATAGQCITSVWAMHYLHNWAYLEGLKKINWELWGHMVSSQSVAILCCPWFVLEFY